MGSPKHYPLLSFLFSYTLQLVGWKRHFSKKNHPRGDDAQLSVCSKPSTAMFDMLTVCVPNLKCVASSATKIRCPKM